ncbi:TetR/AcrR family transcriptional regulator [Allonocardiopsis opalescens]|uniref:TetR family transcriptional regulator n=1 Tax=Allonocardiopsis opalescens TaxID=1144618 RepID=A0A2T0PVI2_9ACTN|nr:TetR/AcrR family transcriptional regulator [Allonocardiopsis opalescens]PRX95542.1 TetR family transcriptional regulator [Allonocardiopsis opalescens]
MAEGGRQRRDVVANRARIVAAATALFQRRGLSADMRAVAKAAGVGIGTLYRHFPTRDDLVREVTGTDLGALAAAALPPGLPALDALRAFFTSALGRLVGNQAMVDLLANSEPADAEMRRCLDHLTEVGRQAVERARHDGTLAADVTATDIAYQFVALVRILQLIPNAAASDVDRHTELVLRALRPGPESADR